MAERIKITKGIQPVDPHTAQNEVRMLGNSLKALRAEDLATHQSQFDPRFKKIGEKIAHLEGRL